MAFCYLLARDSSHRVRESIKRDRHEAVKVDDVNVLGRAKLSDLVDGNCEIIHEEIRGLILYL